MKNAPPGSIRPSVDPAGADPVIEAYKKDIDRSLLRENLKLTAEERIRKLIAFLEFRAALRRAYHSPR